MPGPDLPDLEARLRRLPAAVAVEAPAGLAERIARRGRGRRRLRRAAAAAVVAGLLGGVIATRAAVLDRTPTPVLGPGLVARDATPGQLADGRWQALPPLPPGQLAPRSGAAVVWTGQQLIVWGGLGRDPFRSFADGAAYDPRTGRWEPLPPAPEGQWLPEDDGIAVWTGHEVLVWGGMTVPDPVAAPGMSTRADGVAYDPARRSWRRLPVPPQELRWTGADYWAVWTGRELVAGGVEEVSRGGVRAAAYDPAADRWRLLPRSPALTGGRGHLRARAALWAGSRLLVWNFWSRKAKPLDDRTAASGLPEAEPDGIDLWAYDPAVGRWTVLPAPPDQVRQAAADGSMVWTGRDVVLASAQADRQGTVGRAGRYDPERARWTPITPPPGAAGARVVLTWAGAAVMDPLRHTVHDPAADRWLPTPPRPEPAGGPPLKAGGVERALLWVVERATGAVQVHVLVPGRPAAGP